MKTSSLYLCCHWITGDSQIDSLRSSLIESISFSPFTLASYRPDRSCTQVLLDKTNCILAKNGKVSCATLWDYLQELEQTACQQLFALDLAQQCCKQLLACHEAIQAALDKQAISDAKIHIKELQVSSSLKLVHLLILICSDFALNFHFS